MFNRLHDWLFAEKLEDVPTDVIVNVLKKWEPVKESWDVQWTICSMCEYMLKRGKKCRVCPLMANCWCTADQSTSRIHPDYHGGNLECWRKDLGYFKQMLRDELKRRGESEKVDLNKK